MPPLLMILPIINSNEPKRTVRRKPSRDEMMGSHAVVKPLAQRETTTSGSGLKLPDASSVSNAIGTTKLHVQSDYRRNKKNSSVRVAIGLLTRRVASQTRRRLATVASCHGGSDRREAHPRPDPLVGFSTTIAELEAVVVFGPRRVAGYLASHPLCPFVLDDVRNDAPKS